MEKGVRLTLYQPGLAPVHLSLEDELITMGRAADCTIPIKDRYLSRRHAELVRNESSWVVRDNGSANGTFVNGVRIESVIEVRPGDRISLGDSELVLEPEDQTPSISFGDATSSETSFSLPIQQIDQDTADGRGAERLQILNRLAIELIEDRPMTELFDFIVDRVMHLMRPSRAALALLAPDRRSFVTVKMRRSDLEDPEDLVISRTLLQEVIEERKVLAFTDVAEDEHLAQAKSIISQRIRSALCAPLIVGDTVLGVLYLDYLLSQRNISQEDVKLAGQIARFAAVKLETTRLREESLLKQKMDEELRTAYEIQSRLLPESPPQVDGYQFAGLNRPLRTVSGDYYDFAVRPDGRIYFVIADVSGKGITAALVMASLATAFTIFSSRDPIPSVLVSELNATLAPKTAPRKFVTLFAGVLDTATGLVRYTNAGHTPPYHLRAGGVTTLTETDMVVGLFPQARYRDHELQLAPGDALVLFTDGVVEAENDQEVELGADAIAELIATIGADSPAVMVEKIERAVMQFVGTAPLNDDVTILALRRE
ncbi:MAG TPA: SpoIIE family protein phosphatase [Thermoanaerobaculia bacterium]|nr:SpoIIE family protein phosphatase [Thermoanaerobaculia bacterium]